MLAAQLDAEPGGAGLTGDGRIDTRRKAALVVASVAVNASLITALSLNALGPRRVAQPKPPLILLEIQPRPLLRDERPRPVVAASESEAPPRSRARDDAAPQARRPDPAYEGRSAPVQPRLAVQPPPGAPAPDTAWQVDPTDRRGAMSRSLRLGAAVCGAPELLNEMERRHCRERFGERAAAAPPITGTGNPERDAAFARQGARRLAQWEAQRRPLSGGVGVVGPADCVGSNFGTGCAGAQLPDVPGVDMRQGGRTTHNGGERRPQGFSASIGGIRIGGDDD